MGDMTARGDWRLARRSGLLPPLRFMRKRIGIDAGATLIGPVRLPFRVERHGARTLLRYRLPLLGLVDELRPDGRGGHDGRARLGPLPLGAFAMWPARDGPTGR